MKKLCNLMTVAFVAIIITANTAVSSPQNFKYATVDLEKVVASSKQINALRTEHNAKLRDLSKFVQNAQKQLSAETDAKKKAALQTKLNDEFNTKKKAAEKEYAAKLVAIDKNISDVIAKKAKQKGYDMVLAKSLILYSVGTDITADVIQSVK